jgi:prepilin peptidase CpaA
LVDKATRSVAIEDCTMSSGIHLWVGVALSALALLLCSAVASDWRAQRIPNRLVLAGLALAFGLHGAAALSGQTALAGPHLWSPLAGLLAGGGLLLPLYLLRACGAGDVKLMAMVGAFVGAPTALAAAIYAMAAGDLLALALLLWRGAATQAFTNLRFMLFEWSTRAGGGQGLRLAPLHNSAARLPYALAIGAGTLIALLPTLRSLD